MLDRIKAYEARLSQDPSAFFPPHCARCAMAGALRKHEFRRRIFWAVVLQEVMKVASFVLRVACDRCGARTTVLPDFALPCKRYVLPEVIDTSDRYLLDNTATYESCARVDGLPVFHNSEGRSRARSTVHRWVGFLGRLIALLAHATDLLRQLDTSHSPLAELVSMASLRARSQARRELLARAHRLLRARTSLHRCGGQDLFPRVATPALWS